MFQKPDYVFKDGELVARNGRIVRVTCGATHTLRPHYDQGFESSVREYFERFHTVRSENFRLSDEEIENEGRGRVIIQPCNAGS
jgi:formylmethanofuran dehydrogenase subunit A